MSAKVEELVIGAKRALWRKAVVSVVVILIAVGFAIVQVIPAVALFSQLAAWLAVNSFEVVRVVKVHNIPNMGPRPVKLRRWEPLIPKPIRIGLYALVGGFYVGLFLFMTYKVM